MGAAIVTPIVVVVHAMSACFAHIGAVGKEAQTANCGAWKHRNNKLI
jgi:hypothetical protein